MSNKVKVPKVSGVMGYMWLSYAIIFGVWGIFELVLSIINHNLVGMVVWAVYLAIIEGVSIWMMVDDYKSRCRREELKEMLEGFKLLLEETIEDGEKQLAKVRAAKKAAKRAAENKLAEKRIKK